MRFQVFLSLLNVTSGSCIDKIPEVAKTKVSKPKRYSLSKLIFCHTPQKRIIQTCPHIVYITMWKYLHNAAQMFMQSPQLKVVSIRHHSEWSTKQRPPLRLNNNQNTALKCSSCDPAVFLTAPWRWRILERSETLEPKSQINRSDRWTESWRDTSHTEQTA